jgi:hypothetical protein
VHPAWPTNQEVPSGRHFGDEQNHRMTTIKTLRTRPPCKSRPIRRSAFRLVYRRESQPLPNRYWITAEEMRNFLGITARTQRAWLRAGTPPIPVRMPDNLNPNGWSYRYLYDELAHTTEGLDDWLTVFRRNRREWVEHNSVHDYQYYRNHGWADKARAYRNRKAGTATTS